MVFFSHVDSWVVIANKDLSDYKTLKLELGIGFLAFTHITFAPNFH